MNWYYVDAGQQAGPVDDAQLEELLRTGKIQSDTLVWREGMANWQPYSTAKAPSPPPAAPADAGSPPVMGQLPQEAVCTECGRIFPIHEMIRHKSSYICAGCKPVFMQKLSEGMAGGGRAGGERPSSFGSASLEEVMARDYEHDLGGYFSRAWETFKNNAGIIIGASVLVYLCLMAVNLVPYISFILSLILSGPMMGGLWIFYVKKVRGLEAGIGDAFGGFGPRFGHLLLAHLVSTLLTWLCLAPAGIVGIILFIMSNSQGGSPFDSGMGVALIVVIAVFGFVGMCGAIYYSICWIFAVPLVADKGMDFWSAMGLSRKVVGKHWWMSFLIYIVVSLVATVGLLALCVGILVSAPVAFTTLACAYDKLFGDLAPEP